MSKELTDIEKLQKIRDWCQDFLDNVASKRTPGKWIRPSEFATHIVCTASKNYGNMVCDCADSTPDSSQYGPDATFIASCAGPMEAACKTTIAAIDGLSQPMLEGYCHPDNPVVAFDHQLASKILTIWEGIV